MQILSKLFIVFLTSFTCGYLLFTFCFFNEIQISGSDYKSYITGAKIILGGERNNLYTIETQEKYQKEIFKNDQIILPFRMLPLFAFIFIPFSFASLTLGYRIYYLLNILLAIVCVILFSKFFEGRKLDYLLLVFIFFPLVANIIFAQIIIILMILYLLVLLFFKKDRYLAGGVLSSVLINKPHFLIFILFLFLMSKRKIKFLTGLFLGLVVMITFSLSVVGFEGFLSYPGFLLRTENTYYGGDIVKMISVPSVISFILKSRMSIIMIYLINLFILLSFTIYFFSKSRGKNIELLSSSSTLAALAFLPHSWYHDLTFMLISIAYILKIIKLEKSKEVKIILNILLVILVLIYFIGKLISNLVIPFILLFASIILLNQDKLRKLRFARYINFAKLNMIK
ncbi:MAG: hypothetical protein US60_C0016G0008 [Microgenomates group bacterium GW2011_GWC1_37_8]|uniref:DUF2029 domain-containing protein n=1 Tax=Candidatus Woesebacteria bacterium GW2011_GWB1_38_8 TaxID=1618570 RepID=A0A0G0P8M3_9BACT|nr:MAG: hypothetical protein US60_C0016G0008 [Microgenomates group bacterium GW2011_GWC1_37_8]KKQ85646.1 MAG: hypothetical protein UT08_C0005G0097 [Candidatus Woesebacteria bacterium GW2011_GWB1_38_8]